MKTKLIWAGLGAAAVVGWVGCTKPVQVASTPPPLVVRTVPVAYSDRAVPVRATGLLSRKAEADLSFKVGGMIEAVLVRAGDEVKRGQELARLRFDEIDAQVAQAASVVEKARRDLARVEKLTAGRVATLENLQDARTAVDLAAAQLRIAEFNRKYAVVVAPDDGRILRRLAEPNEWVTAGKEILAFASDVEGWLVRAGLADADAARIRIGDRVTVTHAGPESGPVAGRVTHISESADATTRTTPVEIQLEEVPRGVRSGVVVVATIQPGAVAARPVVPAAVLVEGEARTASVFLLDEAARTVKRVAVEIETIEGDNVYLRTALPRGQRIVSGGAEYLRDGSEVTLKP